MRKIKMPWNTLYGFIERSTARGVTRMGLGYVAINGNLDKKQPITIIDHLAKTSMGIQKEGIEINVSGNPFNLDFDTETVYVPK
jgi:hypothetical protein